jgi:dipeptidyl aminopeptidase/acylaminoacyl peptidase
VNHLKTTVLFVVCAAFAIGCAPEPTPQEIPEYSIEAFLGTTSYMGASFSPDKSKLLVSSDTTGIYNAFEIPVSGGDPVQLTSSTTDSILAVSYFPGDERILYMSDQGGNELHHLFVRELDGSAVDLTPGEGLKAQFEGWAHDDQSFFVTSNERDPRFFDLYEYAIDGYSREMFYQNDEGYQIADVSPDKRYLAFVKLHTMSDTSVHLYDRSNNEMHLITPHEGDVRNQAMGFSADGTVLYLTTDEGREFTHLVRYDLGSGDREVVVESDWDVARATTSKGGKYLLVAINNDARTEVRIYETATMQQLSLPEIPAGDIGSMSVSRDEQTMAFYVSGDRNPNDLFVYEIGGDAPRQLTSSLSPAIDPGHLVEGRVVRFNSWDGLEIPGVLYTPHGAGPDNRVPAVVWVHGGPGGQSRIGYFGLIQYLVNHGYAVYAINNRGSSGYGKTFNQLDDRNHGEGDLGDCVASKKMLVETAYADPERIGITGGSYGGYMVLAALTLQPEEFAVGVDIFGISNWIRTLENIPPWWEAMREALYREMGDPGEDVERLTRISPLFNADKIVRPLMVLQGANDPRVLQVESDDIVEAARANGVPVEYVVFDDEGHGFQKKENQLSGYKAILAFLDEHLK